MLCNGTSKRDADDLLCCAVQLQSIDRLLTQLRMALSRPTLSLGVSVSNDIAADIDALQGERAHLCFRPAL